MDPRVPEAAAPAAEAPRLPRRRPPLEGRVRRGWWLLAGAMLATGCGQVPRDDLKNTEKPASTAEATTGPSSSPGGEDAGVIDADVLDADAMLDADAGPEADAMLDAGAMPGADAMPDADAVDGANAVDSGGPTGSGCCSDGDCICRDEPPATLTDEDGPYAVEYYHLLEVGCVYYPSDAEPPFSAIAFSDGFVGSGGCARSATRGWGEYLASWGIVTMIVHTEGGDQPPERGQKLSAAIEAFKAEHQNEDSPLHGQLAGRYGTGGFSMGGGGSTLTASHDPTLRSNMALMPWMPVGEGITVPSLFTLGSSDGLAGTMGADAYHTMPEGTPRILVTVRSGHAGQPTSGGGQQGAWGLAFQKRYLDGDERWGPLLVAGGADAMSAVD